MMLDEKEEPGSGEMIDSNEYEAEVEEERQDKELDEDEEENEEDFAAKEAIG